MTVLQVCVPLVLSLFLCFKLSSSLSIKMFQDSKGRLKKTKNSDYDPLIIKERIEEVARGKLLKDDASKYGVCAILAQEHLWLGNLKDAEVRAKEAIEAASHTPQADNIYEAYAEGVLGEVLYAEGNYKESAEHLHKALQTYERHLRTSTGPEAVLLVAATQLISWMSLASNETKASVSSCKKALSMTERLLGPDHPDTAASMFNLATANFRSKDFGRGTEGLLNRCLEIYDLKGAGSEHKEAKKSALNLLSKVYIERGEYEKAQLALLRVLDLYNAGYLEGSDVIDEFVSLGNICMYENDNLRANLFYNRAVGILEKMKDYDPNHTRLQAVRQLALDSARAL